MATAKKRRRNPEEETEECSRCHRPFPPDQLVELESGRMWCDECRSDHAFRCDRCNGLFDADRETTSTVEDRNITVCESCAERLGVFTCSTCGRTFSESRYGGSDEHGDYTFCSGCYDEESDEESSDSEPIQGYHSHERLWNRFGDAKHRIYYGVELEAVNERGYNNYTDVAETIKERYQYLDGKEFLFTEDDCTLRDKGYETIFHPVSPEFLRDNKKLYGKILGDMVKMHMVSYEAPEQGISAGMHVSVMWNRLRKWEKRKLLALIYENVRLTTAVSRRLQEHLESYARVRPPAPLTQMVMKKHGYHAKMVAVNLKRVADARIGKTIELAEVRIFRGTLKLESFIMNIEYVIACVELAKDIRYGMMETTEKHILGYIHEHRKTYPHIYAWLKEKGLVK